jgi:hypothetical protein
MARNGYFADDLNDDDLVSDFYTRFSILQKTYK